MKKINLKILLSSLTVIIIVLLSIAWKQNATISNFPVTETALWRSAKYAIPATQTQAFISTVQSWTATPTPSVYSIGTFTPTPTPATPPPPTATFPVITPMTVMPLSDVHLSGKVYYLDFRYFDLDTYYFGKPFEIIKPPDYFYDPPLNLYQGVWSNDNKYLAYPATLKPIRNSLPKYADIGVCILSANQDNAKCIRIYTNIYNHLSITQGSYAEIYNISWSPDSKYLLVTVKGLGVTSPCLVEVDTNSVDCRWANIYGGAIYKVLAGAHAISWSPKDENKLVIPLKTNWYPMSDGVKNGHDISDIPPWDLPTDNLEQGLYLVDIDSSLLSAYPPADDRILRLLWKNPQNTTMNPGQLPVWTSDGDQIVFVYVDPWFNVEKSLRYSMLPVANYVVGMIGKNGENFQKVFDSRIMYLSGVLPSESSPPIIQIHRWLYQDRFLLFTAQIYHSVEEKYKQSLFLYDTKTRQFFQLTTWTDIG